MSSQFEQFEFAPGVPIPWQFLERCPLAVALVRENGLIEWENAASSMLWRKEPPGKVNLMELEPRAFMEERVTFLRRLALAEKNGVIRDIWRGRQILSFLTLLPRRGKETLRYFFSVQEPMSGPTKDLRLSPDTEFFDPVHQDLGPLAVLSPRELEILALVGEGLTAGQIAKQVHRSEQTITSHRAALLSKLGCRNAVQLAVIADRAGIKSPLGDQGPSRER